MVNKLDKAFEYYKNNKEVLLKDYNGEFVAIDDDKVVCHGKDKLKVIQEMIDKQHTLGEFLVHLVAENGDTIQRFYSRV